MCLGLKRLLCELLFTCDKRINHQGTGEWNNRPDLCLHREWLGFSSTVMPVKRLLLLLLAGCTSKSVLEMIRLVMVNIATFLAAFIILGVLLFDPQHKRLSNQSTFNRKN